MSNKDKDLAIANDTIKDLELKEETQERNLETTRFGKMACSRIFKTRRLCSVALPPHVKIMGRLWRFGPFGLLVQLRSLLHN